jgi:ATP-dependent RNA helicase DeaD
MLSMGFLEEITDIIKQCPVDRQTTLFSATIPDDIERIGSRYMRAPEKISLSADGIAAREIHHSYYMVSGMNRSRDLLRVLAVERPESAIIFCNTREETSYVAEFLKKHGLDAEAISSDLTQKDRERVMGRTKEKNLHYLVATDIAARGIDVSDLSHVINYTFPESAEVYVHRTGRTGRAGKSGTAISLIAPRELGNFYMLKLTYKIKPEERQLPVEDSWKSVKEAERVDELKEMLGNRTASEDWIAVARRLWVSDGGEQAVALLVEERLMGRAPAPDPQAAAIPVAAAAQPSQSMERKAEPKREERPRDERPREDEGGKRGARGRRGRTREESRRHSKGGEKSAAPAREKADKPRIAETIDTSDGREFWEAWVDSKSGDESAPPAESANASAPAPERAPEKRERREEAPLAPGQIRLYLNLGRRDGLKEPEIQALLDEKQVAVDALEVRNSHTYLIVQEAREAEVCTALTGGLHGDRQIVCERAKR